MAFRRTLIAFAAAVALCPTAARADLADAAKVVGAGLALFGPGGWVLAGKLLLVGGTIYGGIEQRRAARRQRERQVREYNDALEARTTTAITAAPPHRCNYGRCIAGGDILAIFTTDKTATREDGSTYTKPDALQHLVIHMQTRQAAAIHEVYIDGVPVGALDSNGIPTGGAFASTESSTRDITFTTTATLSEPALEILGAVIPGGSGLAPEPATVTISGGGLTLTGPTGIAVRATYRVANARATVRVQKLLGTPDQAANAYLQSVAPTKWTANHRGRGLAGLIVTLDLEDSRFQGGIPNITADGSWALVYDRRKDSTQPGGSGAHRADQPATWEWSDNASLCAEDFLASELGYGVDRLEDVDAALAVAAANVCDETITLDDGAGPYTGKRYTCNGAFTGEDDRDDIRRQLADCMAGSVVPAAQWQITAGSWTPPVADLTDADLAGSIEILQADTDTDALMNGARARFTALGKAAPEDVKPPYANAALVTEDGAELWGSYGFRFTNSNARVRNLLRIFVERTRNGLTVQYPAKLKAWGLPVGARLRLSSDDYGWAGKTFRVTDRRATQQAPVMLTLQEDAAEIWDEADAGTADVTPNTGLADPFVVGAVSGLAAASGTSTLFRSADGGVQARVVVTWAAVADSYVVPRGRVLVRWRSSSSIAWREVAPLPGDSVQATIDGATDGDTIIIGVRLKNTLGQVGPESFVGHRVVGKSALPAIVSGLASSAIPGGVLLTVTPSTEADVIAGGALELRTGASWAAGTRIFRGAGDRYTWPWPAAGTYTVRAKWIDSSGNESASDAALSVTVGNGNLISTAALQPGAATEVVNSSGGYVAGTTINSTYGISPYYAGMYGVCAFVLAEPATVEIVCTFNASHPGSSSAQLWTGYWISVDNSATKHGSQVIQQPLTIAEPLNIPVTLTAVVSLAAGQHVVGVNDEFRVSVRSPGWTDLTISGDVSTRATLVKR